MSLKNLEKKKQEHSKPLNTEWQEIIKMNALDTKKHYKESNNTVSLRASF